MASRHHSLNLSELADVTDLLSGFEAMNRVKVVYGFETMDTLKGQTLAVKAQAWTRKGDPTGVRLLASVSVVCSTLNLKSWNAALTHVLYALDFQLALAEWDATRS